jgi:hypothetical protein
MVNAVAELYILAKQCCPCHVHYHFLLQHDTAGSLLVAVYNQDNRLKVARDEAKYEAEQKELRDKHQAAERGFRHQLLLQRARERRAVRTSVHPLSQAQWSSTVPPVCFLMRTHVPPCPVQDTLPALPSEDSAPVAAVLGPAPAAKEPAMQLEKEPAMQLEEVDVVAAGSEDRVAVEEASMEQQQRKRQRGGRKEPKPKQQQLQQAQTLADLARLMQQEEQEATHRAREARQQQQLAVVAESTEGRAVVVSGPATQQAQQAPLEHINLFADEEAKAAHPEVKAEQRAERQRRGKEDMQTSDPKFDERFKFGHGLTGKEAMPWYARSAPPPFPADQHLPASEQRPQATNGQQQGQHGPHAHKSQLAKWREAATVALVTAASPGTALGGGGLEAGARWDEGDGSNREGGGAGPLLDAVRAVPAAEAARRSRERGKHGSKRKSRKSGSSSSEDESSSSSSGSEGERRRRRKEKGAKKDKGKRRSKKSSSRPREGGSGSGADLGAKLELMESLRRERLEREEAERRRQHSLMVAAGGGQPVGKKYHGGFGFGRR